MIRLPLLLLCLWAGFPLFGQISDNFDTVSSLEELQWFGDTADFIINESGLLQLDAIDPGSSFIYKKTNLPDSLEISFSFKMDFSPSANNMLQVMLFLDTFDLSLATGYYLEIGENGTDDKISLVRIINGEALVIGQGNPGEFSAEPAEATIKIRKDNSGLWKIYIRDQESFVFRLDLELFDSTIIRYFDQYFGFTCIYTSTRKDKFFFDDVFLGEIVPDTKAPELVEGKVFADNFIELKFDEVLDKVSAMDVLNYEIVGPGTHPLRAIFNEFKPNKVVLEFEHPFSRNEISILRIKDLKDLNGNKILSPIDFPFHLAEKPLNGDLVINEILFNPYEEGDDFVELLNTSNKIISLKGLTIENRTKSGSEKIISTDLDLFPGEYLLLSPDPESLNNYYNLPEKLINLKMVLPSFNNDEGNVTLYDSETINPEAIDSFDYDESMHFTLISDTEGLSLERLFPDLESNDPSNWQTASSLSGGATPGYKNSQYSDRTDTISEYFTLKQKLLSPDNDGYQDQLILEYKMPEAAYVANLRIFNGFGQLVRVLVNNHLLGRDGVITWDGLNGDGHYLPIGPYLILCEVFNQKGDVFKQKLLCYLAEKN